MAARLCTAAAVTVTLMLAVLVDPVSSSNRDTHLGCYADNLDDRILNIHTFFWTNNKASVCIDYCVQRGHTYAGLQNGYECWCGNSLGGHAPGGHVCSYQCPGDATQTCGGGLRMDIYQITDRCPPNYEVFEGQCYRIIRSSFLGEQFNFAQASTRCGEDGGRLPSIKDSQAHGRITRYRQNASPSLTSLIYLNAKEVDGTYKWLDDNSNVDSHWTHWDNRVPKNEDCVMMTNHHNAYWNTFCCSTRVPDIVCTITLDNPAILTTFLTHEQYVGSCVKANTFFCFDGHRFGKDGIGYVGGYLAQVTDASSLADCQNKCRDRTNDRVVQISFQPWNGRWKACFCHHHSPGSDEGGHLSYEYATSQLCVRNCA